MNRDTINTKTIDEALTCACPQGLNGGKCLADACMGWLWHWANLDGFEREEARGVDWGELGEEALQRAWLEQQLGEEGAALASDLENASDYDAQEEAAEAINEALAEKWTTGAEGDTALDKFATENRPGDDWGLAESAVESGQMVVIYQRPARKRGYCGFLLRSAA